MFRWLSLVMQTRMYCANRAVSVALLVALLSVPLAMYGSNRALSVPLLHKCGLSASFALAQREVNLRELLSPN